MWAVEGLESVRRPEVRRGCELFVVVRWAGVNPLFESPWGVSEVPITALTPGTVCPVQLVRQGVGARGSIFEGEGVAQSEDVFRTRLCE